MTNALPKFNALTVDVEDYFHASAFAGLVPCEGWDRQPSRVEHNTKKVLDLLAEYSLHGTFFVLGWVARRYPSLVRQIQDAGHDLGCHSYSHRLIYKISPKEFRDDTRQATAAIEDAAGVAVRAYRAPTFSITSRSVWALEILLELGFTIDSSVFPTHNHLYGIANAPHRPFRIRIQGSELIEYPLPALKLGCWGMPVTGGVYLRLVPFRLQYLGLKRMESRAEPIVLYFHPWELDLEQPRLASASGPRFYHYAGLDRTEQRLRGLFNTFSFGKLAESGLAASTVYTLASADGPHGNNPVFVPVMSGEARPQVMSD